MEKQDADATQEQFIQRTAETGNDNQVSLLQLMAPFIEAAPPGKLSEVVFHLKSLLMRLLAVRNHGASPHGRIPANELHNFLQNCIPALCLRRILQKDGNIVSLATTKVPQIQDQLSQGTTHSSEGKVGSGLAPRSIHLALSHTNHLLSWVMKVNSSRNMDASGYGCDAGQGLRASVSSWYQQRSVLSATLSELTSSLPPGVAALPSYGADIKTEDIFPWLSDLAETSHSTGETSFLSATVAEAGPQDRKNRFLGSFEGDANTMVILGDLKKFFSHIPSIFVAGQNEDTEVNDAKDNSRTAQEFSPSLEGEVEEVEEEEDLFSDLYAVSYGFDRLENVFFDLYLGLYVEVDVVMGRCIRVISFSTVDEVVSSTQDLPTSLFLFHQELKLQRQPDGKSTAKETVETTEHMNSEEGVPSKAVDYSNELEVNIPLFDPFFSGMRKKLEAELQAQLKLLEEDSLVADAGVKGIDKGENLCNLLREYRDKWSAMNKATIKVNDADVSEPLLAWRLKNRMTMGAASAFTAVVWPLGFSVNIKADHLPGEPRKAELPGASKAENLKPDNLTDHASRDLVNNIRLEKPFVLSSTLSVTYCKSRGAPVRGWRSMWTSRYELCRVEQRHGGMDTVSQKEFSPNASCDAKAILDDNHQCHRRASSLGIADASDVSSSTSPGTSGETLNRTNNTPDSGCPSSESHKSLRDATTREVCSFIFCAISEVWLFHEPAAGAGTGGTHLDFINSSSEAGPCGACDARSQEAPHAFSATPGGMHQRWVVRCTPEGLVTASVSIDVVAEAMISQINKHEQIVRDSIIRACNRILRPRRSMGICRMREEARSPLSSLLSQYPPFLASKTHFDPFRYDESILCVPFPSPSQEESC